MSTYRYDNEDGSGEEARLTIPRHLEPPEYLRLAHKVDGWCDFALSGEEDE